MSSKSIGVNSTRFPPKREKWVQEDVVSSFFIIFAPHATLGELDPPTYSEMQKNFQHSTDNFSKSEEQP